MCCERYLKTGGRLTARTGCRLPFVANHLTNRKQETPARNRGYGARETCLTLTGMGYVVLSAYREKMEARVGIEPASTALQAAA